MRTSERIESIMLDMVLLAEFLLHDSLLRVRFHIVCTAIADGILETMLATMAPIV
jgi:hypothetical protein